MLDNYKSCPLKKRPIVYVKDEQWQIDNNFEQEEALALIKYCEDQPQDLSLKRKAGEGFEDYDVAAKREYVLNLSNKSANFSRPPSPDQEFLISSIMLSPKDELDMEYHPNNIHLRDVKQTTKAFQSAFTAAAGCKPMNLLCNIWQPQLAAIFPSPASSIGSSTSPCSTYSYKHITPPPSPPPSSIYSEPEDLSVRNDIPLPILYSFLDDIPKEKSFSSYASVAYNHYNTKSTLNRSSETSSHTETHNKTYRYKCEKCKKMYSTSMGLNKHEQFHCPATERNQNKKQHSCEDCGKIYTTIGALKMHIRTHTLPCKCHICGKAFSRPWLLQGHIRTHTGEKPFQCLDCPRSFADRSNLRAHQQTHFDVKKYACKVCNKSFSRMSLLNKHASSYCTITVT